MNIFSASRPLALAAIAAAAILSGCGSFVAPVIPPTGGAYTHIAGPLDLDSHNGKQIGPKKGEASSGAWLGFWATGDCSIEAAARSGGIKNINHVDYHYENVLWGFRSNFTTVVYGE